MLDKKCEILYISCNGVELCCEIAVVDPGAVPGASTNGGEIGSTREIKATTDTRYCTTVSGKA